MVREDRADSRLIHHQFQVTDFGVAVVTALFGADGLVTNGAGTANVCMPSAAKLIRVGIHALCGAINVAGDWTLRIRVNEAGADSATLVFPCAASPGSKTANQMSVDFIIQAGSTYNVQADGPSRNIFIARATVEWEVL